jgi:hypothetical protein
MYILGLSSSWGTSRIRPAWSPCEHQLTPALSPIWGPRPKPRRPEEVVYGPNDSCSHFTQRLFPPKLPQQHTCTIFSISSPSSILIIHHIQTIFTSFIIRQSFHYFFSSSWQADCSRSLVSNTAMIFIIYLSVLHLVTAWQIYGSVHLQSKKSYLMVMTTSAQRQNISLIIWNRFCYNMILF